MIIGAKAKVIEMWSVFCGETVELVDETDTEYIFTNDKHKRWKLIVPKNIVANKDLWHADSSLVALLTGEAVIINE